MNETELEKQELELESAPESDNTDVLEMNAIAEEEERIEVMSEGMVSESASEMPEEVEQPESWYKQPDTPILSCRIQGQILQDVLSQLRTLVDEAKIDIDSEGLRIRAVDPAHIAMIEIILPNTAFWEYRYDGFCGVDDDGKEKANSIAIDLDKIANVLKALGKKLLAEEMDISITTKTMILETPYGTRKTKLIDPTGFSDPRVPDVYLPSVFVIEQSQMSKIKGFMRRLKESLSIPEFREQPLKS